MNYQRSLNHYKENMESINVKTGGGRNQRWMQIIKYLHKKSLDPAIFFWFRKKKCGEAADLLSAQDLTSGADDKGHIHQFYQRTIYRCRRPTATSRRSSGTEICSRKASASITQGCYQSARKSQRFSSKRFTCASCSRPKHSQWAST